MRIWAKQWSEIVADCEVRLQYYTDSLEHDPASEHASEYLDRTYGDLVPPSLKARETA